LSKEGLDLSSTFLYNYVTVLYKTTMTVTKNEFGQMNMFAKEPTMWMSEEDIERYGFEPYAEKAEKANGRWAMLGFIAGIASYVATGKLFFGIF